MSRKKLIITAFGLLFLTACATKNGSREVTLLDKNWQFINEEVAGGEKPETSTVTKTVKFLQSSRKAVIENPIPYRPNTKDIELTHVTGDVTSGLGWGSPATVKVSALFKHGMLENYVGMELSQVIIFVNDVPSNTSVEVYTGSDMLVPGPVNLETTENFTPSGAQSQSFVTLSTPVLLSGDDLWVGWQLDDPGADVFPAGMEAEGPPQDDANWTKYGPSWSELTNPDYGDFGIIGILTGSAVPTWIDINTAGGTITGGNSDEVEVSFDVAGLTNGTYNAVIAVKSNDPDDNESSIEIPVTLDYANSVSDIDGSAIMTFPNPAKDILNIVANKEVTSIVVMSIAGQEVYSVNPNANTYKMNLNELPTGVYVFTIKTNNQTITRKVIVE